MDVGYYRVAGIALAVSLLTVLSMARLWDEAFWKPTQSEANNPPLGTVILAPVTVLAILTLALALAAEPVLNVSRRAADQLLQPDGYVRAVLGGQ